MLVDVVLIDKIARENLTAFSHFTIILLQDDPLDSIKLARVSMSGKAYTAIIDIDKTLGTSRNMR